MLNFNEYFIKIQHYMKIHVNLKIFINLSIRYVNWNIQTKFYSMHRFFCVEITEFIFSKEVIQKIHYMISPLIRLKRSAEKSNNRTQSNPIGYIAFFL